MTCQRQLVPSPSQRRSILPRRHLLASYFFCVIFTFNWIVRTYDLCLKFLSIGRNKKEGIFTFFETWVIQYQPLSRELIENEFEWLNHDNLQFRCEEGDSARGWDLYLRFLSLFFFGEELQKKKITLWKHFVIIIHISVQVIIFFSSVVSRWFANLEKLYLSLFRVRNEIEIMLKRFLGVDYFAGVSFFWGNFRVEFGGVLKEQFEMFSRGHRIWPRLPGNAINH